MPRIPCVVCGTIVSTPVKFLLQCSCGFALHHTCIVPVVPKKTLLLMIEASTNGYRAGTLDSWQCPGCKAAKETTQIIQVKKKHVQLHTIQSFHPVSLANVPMNVDMQSVAPQSRKRHVTGTNTSLSNDTKSLKWQLEYARHPSVQTDSEKDTTRSMPMRILIPESSSTNIPHQSSCYSNLGLAFTASADVAHQSSSKTLLADNNDIFQPASSLHSPAKLADQERLGAKIALPIFHRIPETFSSEDNHVPLNTLSVSPPRPPPLLDLRKLLKRKRLYMSEAFQRNLHASSNGNTCESLTKKRRLDCHPNNHQETAGFQCRTQLEEPTMVVDPSRSPHRKNKIQAMRSRTFEGANHLERFIQFKEMEQHSEPGSRVGTNDAFPVMHSPIRMKGIDTRILPNTTSSVISSIQTPPSHSKEFAVTIVTKIEPVAQPSEQPSLKHNKTRSGSPHVSCQWLREVILNRLNTELQDVGEKAHQETTFTDGLPSPPLTDTTDDLIRRHSNSNTEKHQESMQQHNVSVVGVSNFTEQEKMDKASIVTAQDHSDHGSVAEENEVLSELDLIVRRLPRLPLRPRSSHKLPIVSLPTLATCFSSFKPTSKRLGIRL